MTLLQELTIKLAEGLMKKSSTTCSTWTQNYVVLGKPIPGPASFDAHPWSKAMHDCEVSWAGCKAAQMAFTQTALDRALFTIDVKKISVLYILPKRNPDAVDFSRSKFDTMLELSPHLASMFSNVRNVGHKQAGSVDFFLRGCRSKSGLKSISTGMKVFDEYDEMIQAHIPLADERSSGFDSSDKQDIKISTPTIPDFGISEILDKECAEQHYFFTCPNCGKQIEWNSLDNLVIPTDDIRDLAKLKESYLKCPRPECGKKIPHEAKRDILHWSKANWEPVKNATSPMPGFQIPQFYSTVMQPWEIAKSVLRARLDADYEQELWNSKMGLPFEQKGASVSDQDINKCLGGYTMRDVPPTGQLITAGVDVGHKDLYVEITQWLVPPQYGKPLNDFAVPKVLSAQVIHEFAELERLMYDFQILHMVIDVDPYFRDALKFAMKFHGAVSLCRFVNGIDKNAIIPQATDHTVFVNRTSWLDISQGRFRRFNGIKLPNDIPTMYRDHIKSMIRIIKEDRAGQLKPKYVSRTADHFAFAHVYNEIALPLAVSNRTSQDVKDFL